MAAGIFISYRRSDEPHAAALLQLLLARRLPLDDIFIDVGDIEPGDDFVNVLREELASCHVLLAVIGPRWLEERDEKGQRRLDQPGDYVRLEIETALQRGLHIIPVLVNKASMPDAASLPATITALSRLNAINPTLDPTGHGIEPIARKIEKEIEAVASKVRQSINNRLLRNNPYARVRTSSIANAFRRAIRGSILPTSITRKIAPDVFLLQDTNAAISLYKAEPLVAPELPYVELMNWCGELMERKLPAIEVAIRSGRFVLDRWSNGDGDLVRRAGFDAFRESKPKSFDGPAVRVDGYRIAGRRLRIAAQQATYFEQLRSNLILDYRHRLPDGTELSLRDLLRREFDDALPPLNDRRLANTLGVSALIFCRRGDDLTPYLVTRTKETAIFDAGNEWHCTASGVAEMREGEGNATNFMERSIRKELEEEVGLLRNDLDVLAPVAFCRELTRAGKPQFFYLGVTSVPLPEITKKLKGARRRATRFGDIVENTAIPLLVGQARFWNNKSKHIQGKTLSAEAATCLHYYFKCRGDGKSPHFDF